MQEWLMPKALSKNPKFCLARWNPLAQRSFQNKAKTPITRLWLTVAVVLISKFFFFLKVQGRWLKLKFEKETLEIILKLLDFN